MNISKKWFYTYIAIALFAIITCVYALYKKEYIIAVGTGFVFCVQIQNIIKYKQDQFKKR